MMLQCPFASDRDVAAPRRIVVDGWPQEHHHESGEGTLSGRAQ